MRLYHCVNARSFRPLWALEELALDFELVLVPFPPRVLAKDYLDINPLGTVPYFEDGETRLTESAAICAYLGERTGQLRVAPQEAEYGAYLNWLFFSDATLTFPQTLVLRYAHLEPPERRLPQAAEDYAKWFAGRLRVVESALEAREFLAANRFTMADVTIGYALHLADTIPLLRERLTKQSRAYLERMRERPAFQRALARQSPPL